ncbi:MAG: OsmC family protein [Aerococcus sp.]|nr:OsmC family protein [Aerococcus sp.]
MFTSEVNATNQKQYVVEATADDFSYTLDFPDRAGEAAAGASPTTMLLVALAGCHLMTAASYFERQQWDNEGLSIQVRGTFNDVAGEWQVDTQVTLTVKATLTEEQKQGLYDYIKRYCRVGSILENGKNTVDLTITVEA